MSSIPATSPRLRISVVIPSYNGAMYVGRAIRSALEQSYPPLEVVVVDDGSTDQTSTLVAREFGDRVRYHYQPNRGPSAARNQGVHLSQGEWIAFLDVDDHWAGHKLELQAKEVLAHPDVALVGCESTVCGPDGREVAVRRLPKPFSRKAVQEAHKLGNVFVMGVLVRRDVFLSLGGFPENLACGEDRELWARIAASYEVAAVDLPLLRITQLPTSVSSSPQLILRDGFVVNRRVMELAGNRSGLGRWKDRLTLWRADARVYHSAAYMFVQQKEFLAAAQALTQGLLRWPFCSLGNHLLAIRLWTRVLMVGPRPEDSPR